MEVVCLIVVSDVWPQLLHHYRQSGTLSSTMDARAYRVEVVQGVHYRDRSQSREWSMPQIQSTRMK
jgi:hypothetical protein